MLKVSTFTNRRRWVICVTYGRSKSFMIIEIGTNRDSPYANHMSRNAYLLSFRDMTIFWLKICIFLPVLPIAVSF